MGTDGQLHGIMETGHRQGAAGGLEGGLTAHSGPVGLRMKSRGGPMWLHATQTVNRAGRAISPRAGVLTADGTHVLFLTHFRKGSSSPHVPAGDSPDWHVSHCPSAVNPPTPRCTSRGLTPRVRPLPSTIRHCSERRPSESRAGRPFSTLYSSL